MPNMKLLLNESIKNVGKVGDVVEVSSGYGRNYLLPKGLAVALDLDRVPVLPVFKWLAASGEVSEREMLRTFNCGIGMVGVLDANAAPSAIEHFGANGETVVRLGEVVRSHGDARVDFRGRLDLASPGA